MSSMQEVLDAGEEVQKLREDLKRERALDDVLKEDVEEELSNLAAQVEHLEKQASALKDADGKFRLSEYEERIEHLEQARFRNISREHKEALFNLERRVVEKRLRNKIDKIGVTLVDGFGQVRDQMERGLSSLRQQGDLSVYGESSAPPS
ncbi:hypothetical protein DL767_002743 [Monosporascus sp. MG133]|nr:hypothetical protein DL767_002743 [Monosporascus sp. MG133]